MQIPDHASTRIPQRVAENETACARGGRPGGGGNRPYPPAVPGRGYPEANSPAVGMTKSSRRQESFQSWQSTFADEHQLRNRAVPSRREMAQVQSYLVREEL